MTQAVHIIASCTDKKLRPVPPHRRLRALRELPAEVRLSTWWERVRLPQSGETPIDAVNLYAGQHWSVVRELPEVARAAGLSPTLWVASAGYGLIRADTAVLAYSATFAARTEDSVAPNDPAGLQGWWDGLGGVDEGQFGHVRRVADLAASEPGAIIMVIASPAYVRAMTHDLQRASLKLQNPSSLIVFSSETAGSGALAQHVVAGDAALLHRFGGARVSLHARVARNALAGATSIRLEADSLRRRYRRMSGAIKVPAMEPGRSMTDAEVESWLRGMAKKVPGLTHTRALRILRNSGLACEAKRFKRLFLDSGVQ